MTPPHKVISIKWMDILFYFASTGKLTCYGEVENNFDSSSYRHVGTFPKIKDFSKIAQ
jgi:hypothetical protein